MELAVTDGRYGIQFSDWEALTPAQRGALTREFARRAHAARSRAIGKALLGAVAGLFGRLPRPPVSTGTPASARR
jgi:hypothetical protein